MPPSHPHLRSPASGAPPPDAHEVGVRSLDLIACDGCGRAFATYDGPGMIAAMVGPCPDCGGRFQLVDPKP
jgi:hypothetical protein